MLRRKNYSYTIYFINKIDIYFVQNFWKKAFFSKKIDLNKFIISF